MLGVAGKLFRTGIEETVGACEVFEASGHAILSPNRHIVTPSHRSHMSLICRLGVKVQVPCSDSFRAIPSLPSDRRKRFMHKRFTSLSISSLLELLCCWSGSSNFINWSSKMLLLRHRICLVVQNGVIAAPRHTVRSQSTTSHHIRLSEQARTWWQSTSSRKRKVAFVLGGTTVTTIGLLWKRRNGSNYPTDPQDSRALSEVPLSKLCSGWM